MTVLSSAEVLAQQQSLCLPLCRQPKGQKMEYEAEKYEYTEELKLSLFNPAKANHFCLSFGFQRIKQEQYHFTY